ncbi:hypothetical protein FD754_012572 [Muntiacus muntjak]|uniref:ABC transporter domain-containing protein n=1 Tax=Muntiacus muntjak TaxID=9888 RepID=A0A5N3VH48_MUNMU|nr:hypothetical protein FD754_012572 [Muntiacus muntjak]
MTMFRNLKLLLWKNFILKKRKTLVTVLEILMPLLFCVVILYLRFGNLPRKRPPVDYNVIDITSLPEFFNQFPLKSKFQLAYIPSKSETLKNITEMVEDFFPVEFEVLGCPSVPLFEKYIIQDPKAFYVLTGIVFDHNFNDSMEPLPLEVKYHLRFSFFQRNYLSLSLILPQDDVQGWLTSLLYPPNLSQEPRDYGVSEGGAPGYYHEGFLSIQHATDRAIMWHHAPTETTGLFQSLSVLLKRFPHGAYVRDSFFLVLQNEFPLFLMLSFICIELITINSIVLEKERKLKEYMCMMGLQNWQHWVAWFIVFFISASIVVSFMTILFCTELEESAVFGNSDPSLIFVFLMCFAIATIFFAFMISTFFQKAHVATASGGIIFFLTYLPYLYLAFTYSRRSSFQKIAFCLLSNVAMALGVRLISTFEIRGTGIQWRNMGSIGGEFNFTQVLLMLLLDSVLYGLVAWYVEAIFPGEYGTPKPWYFFLMPSYWWGEPTSLRKPVLDLEDPQQALGNKFIQDEPTNLIKGIEIQHLYKVFYKGKDEHVAVKDLTMNLYQGQITVLLGHNGAGKTTTCSILTGLITPSSGKAFINGYEISQDMLQIRKSMGWCPQHDILYDNLTVAEHLHFYAQLKGLPRQKCPEEVKRMLHVLGLEEKRDSQSKFLSGGMRRKLSIGIALITGSKVLMLDEPTSGVDAISRRAIWDLLQQHKSDRTILLTTHFMDEADLLGDRIAIMAKGELQCCGSSLFLKEKYGAGYYITLVRKPHCDTEKISLLIYQHIPYAVFQSSIGEELTFILPKESMHRFEALFTDLELRQEELGIASFGASVTTMEEIFIRVNKLMDSNIDLQIIKLPSFHSHPLVSRVPVNRIRRLHSRIFSIPSGLPIHPNTGVSWFSWIACMHTHLVVSNSFVTSWTGAHQASSVHGISQARILKWQADSFPLSHQGALSWVSEEDSLFHSLKSPVQGEAAIHRAPSLGGYLDPVPVRCMRQGAQGWCTGMTQRDGMEQEVGGGFRMGNTCTPMVDSCQCMAKPVQYCKLRQHQSGFLCFEESREEAYLRDLCSQCVYSRKVPPLAVNKVSFTVQAEECFGLLGLNGAGKTTIFKILTGEESITSGDAFVNSISLSSDLSKRTKKIVKTYEARGRGGQGPREKQITKGHRLCDSVYIETSRTGKSMVISKLIVARGWAFWGKWVVTFHGFEQLNNNNNNSFQNLLVCQKSTVTFECPHSFLSKSFTVSEPFSSTVGLSLVHLHDPDNHDSVITHLEPDILESELEPDMEQQTASKLGKEYVKAWKSNSALLQHSCEFHRKC